MPPFDPPLKNDGPACRVCGCTEHNACPIELGPMKGRMTCSWAKTAGVDKGPLCTACAGTVDDALHTIKRVYRLIDERNTPAARYVAKAFILRYREAQKRG